MSYNRQSRRVKSLIDELKNIRDLLDGIENKVLSIEDEIVTIDNSLPDDTEIAAMAEGQDKKKLGELLESLKEAYEVIGDILGPPSEDYPMEDILRHFPLGGGADKGHLN